MIDLRACRRACWAGSRAAPRRPALSAGLCRCTLLVTVRLGWVQLGWLFRTLSS
jgi:hypothetical protein